MRRILVALLFFSSLAFAVNFKLYLKDGNYHLVREYKVEGDRVKYYSIERSDWEEMPLAMVDLTKTEAEKSARNEKLADETKALVEEDKAVRAAQEEILKIPQDPGVYMLENGSQLKIFKLGESQYHNDKGRSVLKALSPVPLVPGKGTVEMQNDHSLNVLSNNRPELYIQLSAEERFGIIKLTPKHGVRIVERVTVVPVSKELMEEMDEVPIFRKQLTEGWLYKIWPQEALEPGEYAVVQYTQGKMNTQVWDFAVKK